jgi:hypothetical protein
VLCVVPIRAGRHRARSTRRAGAASVGLGLTAVWALTERADVGPRSYAARGLAFAVVGIVVGRYAVQARLRELELEGCSAPDRAPGRASILMIEAASVTPTGD